MSKGSFLHDGLRLAYLDSDERDNRPVLVALHGHLNEGRFIHQGAVPPGISHRIVALDQRGHGESDHARSYGMDDYVADALALLDHLGIEKAAVLWNSLGGAVAYSLAAAAPDRVSGMVVVDIGTVVADDLGATLTFPRRAATREELVAAFGFLGTNQAYVMREYPDGWGVPWDPFDMVSSQASLNDGGHAIYIDDPDGYTDAVRAFLAVLGAQGG